MDLSIELKVPPAALFQGKGAQVVGEEMVAATEYGVATLQAAVVPLTPINLGPLRAGWQTKVDLTGGQANVLGRVFNPMDYAVPVEKGARPHFPPVAPLVLWARRKFSVSEKEAKSIGFLVARAISRRGTKAVQMARKGLESARGAVEARFNAALTNIVRRLGQ